MTPLNRYLLGALLAASLAGPAGAADTGASATPVPFPEAPSLPEAGQIQALLGDRQDLVHRIDAYIQGVHAATEQYRRYMEQVKQLLASCKVQSQVNPDDYGEFSGVVSDGQRLCQGWVAGFDKRARDYAVRLDQAVAFQRRLQQVGEQVQHQIDRLEIMQRARRLKQDVDKGLQDLDESRQNLEPWMNQKSGSQ